MSNQALWLLRIGTLLALVAATALPAAAQEEDEQDGSVVGLVLDLLHEEDPDLRGLAYEQIRTQVPGESATRQFAAQLPKLDAERQVGLLRALAGRGDRAARSAVLEALASQKDPSVRTAAIAALGALGQSDDARLLGDLLQEGSPQEKKAARDSLVRLRGEGTTAALVSLMHGADAALQVAIIQVLTERRAFDAIDALLERALGTDAQVRTAAMAALGELAGPEHLGAMVQGLLKTERGREREAAERAIAQVSHRIEDPNGQAAPLLDVLRSIPPDDRLVALPALGRIGGPAALRTARAAVASRHAEWHDGGIHTLCKWPDASVAEDLIRLAKSDRHAGHREMALSALIRVAPLPDGRPDDERLDLVRQVMDMCRTTDQRQLLLKRASAVRTVETLRFALEYLDQPDYAQQACEAIVELAHHRGLREPNNQEFHQALDRVIATSKDPVVVDRAQRYQKDQTWVRPKD